MHNDGGDPSNLPWDDQKRFDPDCLIGLTPDEMSRQSAAEWLRREVTEFLSVGSVGLYELPNLLANSDDDLGADGNLAVAVDVASALVDAGVAKLCLLRWPRDAIIEGPLDKSILAESTAWDWLLGGFHFALVPISSANSESGA